MDPSTPAGRLAIGILGEVAQHEIDQKSDRQTRAAAQAAEAGRWIGGRKAFGFESDGVTQRPREAAAIREGYAALLAGESLRGIAEQWNDAGFTTGKPPWLHTDRAAPDGNSVWRADSVRRVLMNPRFAGLRAHKGTIVGPAEWPAVVEESTWRAARALLLDEGRRTVKARRPKHFLSGVARCGLCGMLVHGGGATHGKPVYRCRSTHLLPSQRVAVEGTHVNRLVSPVDEYVSEVIVARLARPDSRALLVDDKVPDVGGLREEALAWQVRLDELAAEFGAAAADPLPPREYRAMRQPIVAAIATIEEQIADAGRVSVLGDLVAAEDVWAVWTRLSFDRRRAVVEVLAEVRLHAIGRGTRTFRPETVEFVWKAG